MDAYRPITVSSRLPFPLQGEFFTTTRIVAAEKPLPRVGITMRAELGSEWENSTVVGSPSIQPNGKGQLVQTLQHVRIPPPAEQDAANFEFTGVSIGGQQFDGISRSYVYPRVDFDESDPEPGAAMPTGPDAKFEGKGYILVGRRVASSGMELEPTFVVERREYVRRVTIRNIGIDSLNGKTLASSTILFHRDEIVTGTKTIDALMLEPEHAYWGVQADGTQRTGSQLSADWYSVEVAQLVGGTMDSATGVLTVHSYATNDNFYWPPVLKSYQELSWQRRDGGKDTFPAILFEPEGYNGPCRNVVVQTWSKTPFVINAVLPMLPTRIYYASPFFTLNISECLHGAITAVCDIGSGDPVYEVNSGSARTFPATNYTAWPAIVSGVQTGLLAFDDQEPFRGGFLRTTRTVYPPAFSGGTAWPTVP
jgi:hypothetical protein